MTDPLREALEPCPFCGNADPGVADTGSCWVRCLASGCGCEGPIRDSENDAIKSWNDRAALAQSRPVTAGAWQTANTVPPLDAGHMKEYVIAVYREHSKKVYSFSCSYLNEYLIQYEYCPKDDKKDGFCKGCEDDGCPTTGWFYLTGDDNNESGCYQSLSLEPDDKIMGWRDIPQWDDPTLTPHDRKVAP